MIDAHAHLHSCFRLEAFLDGAAARFRGAVEESGLTGDSPGCLLLADIAGHDSFSRWGDGGIDRACRTWTSEATGEETSVLARRDDGARIFLVAGRQVKTREKLEVLQLGVREDPPGGETAEVVVRQGLDVGALVVLPWGFGKWWGARGRMIRRLLRENDPARLFLGDTSNRLAGSGEPALFREGRRLGYRVLPGTDPFPFQRQERRAGGYGFLLGGALDALLEELLVGGDAVEGFGEGDAVAELRADEEGDLLGPRLAAGAGERRDLAQVSSEEQLVLQRVEEALAKLDAELLLHHVGADVHVASRRLALGVHDQLVDPAPEAHVLEGHGGHDGVVGRHQAGERGVYGGARSEQLEQAGLGAAGCYGLECTTGPSVNRLYMDPDDPNVLFAGTTERGLYRTRDGGRYWEFVDLPYECAFPEPVGKSPTGIYYLGCRDKLYRSIDGGETFEKFATLGSMGRGIITIAFDERLPDRIWAGMCEGCEEYPRDGEGFLFLSDDGGQTWQELGQELDASCRGACAVWDIDICPNDPEQMAVSIYPCGLFTSSDGGISWRRAAAPLDGNVLSSAAYAPTADRCRLYAGEQGVYGLYYTEDAGRSWTLEYNKYLDDLFFNPYLPQMIYGIIIHNMGNDEEFELHAKK